MTAGQMDAKAPLPPRDCIRNYCLWECRKKGPVNYKRGVLECQNSNCPLFLYRTGVLKDRRQPLSEETQGRQLRELKRVRKRIEEEKRVLKQMNYELGRDQKNDIADMTKLNKQQSQEIKQLMIEQAREQSRQLKELEAQHKEARSALESEQNDKHRQKLRAIWDQEDLIKEKQEEAEQLEKEYERQLRAGLWSDKEAIDGEVEEGGDIKNGDEV